MECVIQSWGSRIFFFMDFTLEQKRIMWVVGSLERLGGLGYFNEIGYKVDKDCIDLYWELDDIRDYLFESNEQIFTILIVLLEESNMDLEGIKRIYDLVLDYKENRKNVVSYAMENLCGVG